MSAIKNLVIGGGPAAAAAAVALGAAGTEVTVVDCGLELEADREEKRSRLAETPVREWTGSDLAVFSYENERSAGLGQKRLFGSDFPYRNPDLVEMRALGVGSRPSFASGGLSNVWGAGVLPYGARDLEDWPLDQADLAPHYRAVSELLPLSADDDALSAVYELHREPDGLLVRSSQGDAMLSRLSDSRLARRGWRAGAARLAVRTGRPAPRHGCVYCGCCLGGCPYGHIYNAAQTLSDLASTGAITYRSGLHVERVIEESSRVRVAYTSLATGEAGELEAETVLLGAGALSSTFVLQRSQILGPRAELLDSQTLYLPLLWLGAPSADDDRDRYSLAQAFGLLEDSQVSAHPVHVSFYCYSSDIPDRVRDLRPRLAQALGPLLERATRQMVFAICFLHSDDSTGLSSTMEADAFALSPRRRPGAPRALARLKRKLLEDLPRAGMVPLLPAAEAAEPGGGYHFGGSVPMRASPAAGESDLLGRPHGTTRVHVIDAACFPSIPGGPITLSIMANAHRIATEVAR